MEKNYNGERWKHLSYLIKITETFINFHSKNSSGEKNRMFLLKFITILWDLLEDFPNKKSCKFNYWEFLTVFSMASRSPGNKNNLIYIKFRRFNNGLLSSSGKSWKNFFIPWELQYIIIKNPCLTMFSVAAIFLKLTENIKMS